VPRLCEGRKALRAFLLLGDRDNRFISGYACFILSVDLAAMPLTAGLVESGRTLTGYVKATAAPRCPLWGSLDIPDQVRQLLVKPAVRCTLLFPYARQRV